MYPAEPHVVKVVIDCGVVDTERFPCLREPVTVAVGDVGDRDKGCDCILDEVDISTILSSSGQTANTGYSDMVITVDKRAAGGFVASIVQFYCASCTSVIAGYVTVTSDIIDIIDEHLDCSVRHLHEVCLDERPGFVCIRAVTWRFKRYARLGNRHVVNHRSIVTGEIPCTHLDRHVVAHRNIGPVGGHGVAVRDWGDSRVCYLDPTDEDPDGTLVDTADISDGRVDIHRLGDG